jgi:hypothetical protein
MTTKRIGFACKWIDYPHQVEGIKPKDDCKKYNTGATTVAWLNRQTKEVAEKNYGTSWSKILKQLDYSLNEWGI